MNITQYQTGRSWNIHTNLLIISLASPSSHAFVHPCLNKSKIGYNCSLTGFCEIPTRKMKTMKIITKIICSFAILLGLSPIIFLVVMDILKYCFGIDPVKDERERIRRKKNKWKNVNLSFNDLHMWTLNNHQYLIVNINFYYVLYSFEIIDILSIWAWKLKLLTEKRRKKNVYSRNENINVVISSSVLIPEGVNACYE